MWFVYFIMAVLALIEFPLVGAVLVVGGILLLAFALGIKSQQ